MPWWFKSSSNLLPNSPSCFSMPSMISLIINADDLGSNLLRDRGILDAYRNGIVTSASLLANGSSFETAVLQIKETGLPIGVHLNLADGISLTGPIKGLTDQHGHLPGKQKLRQYLGSDPCDSVALRRELATQIERIFDSGLQPDHLNGHQHCQLFPSLTSLVIDLADTYGILAMRSALSGEPAAEDPQHLLGEELTLYRQLSPAAHQTQRKSEIKIPDGLFGMPLLNRLNTATLCQLLEELPPGRWELMTHPGYPDPQGGPFDGPQRQIELQALLSDPAREILTRRNIHLCTFGDL